MENVTSALVSSLVNTTLNTILNTTLNMDLNTILNTTLNTDLNTTIFVTDLVKTSTDFPPVDAIYPIPDNTTDIDSAQPNTTLDLALNIDERVYLENLSAEAAIRNVAVIVFLALLMIAGGIGNLLVLYVYSFRFKRSSSSYFIISLAIFDLFACAISIPTEIYDILNKYTFYQQSVCILLRYSGTFVQYASAYLLVGVAIDRYIKICHPLKMIPSLKIKWMCIMATVAGFFSSIPTTILFGLKKEKTDIPSIYGSNCSIAQKFLGSRFFMYYFLGVTTLFVICVLMMIVLYALIWCTVKRRRGSVIGDSVRRKPSDSDSSRSASLRLKKQVSVNSDDNNNVFIEEGERSTLKRSSRRRRMSSVSAAIKKIKVTRTTLLLFAVTAAFIISYLPSICAMIFKRKIFRLNRGELVYTFLVKFTFINNAINPIIYSFLNVNFRNECKKVFQKFYCGKNFPPSRQTSMETEEDTK